MREKGGEESEEGNIDVGEREAGTQIKSCEYQSSRTKCGYVSFTLLLWHGADWYGFRYR